MLRRRGRGDPRADLRRSSGRALDGIDFASPAGADRQRPHRARRVWRTATFSRDAMSPPRSCGNLCTGVLLPTALPVGGPPGQGRPRGSRRPRCSSPRTSWSPHADPPDDAATQAAAHEPAAHEPQSSCTRVPGVDVDAGTAPSSS
ncbi:hypothetical protein QJS66_18300 [Kocuria rhizophila]|nr:hypothetical protein QJS66_18300 [Kocuria rhizophila]